MPLRWWPVMRRPRGNHGEPLAGLPKHYPTCTKRRRVEEGCECSMRYYLAWGGRNPKPTAREYRATRRKVRRTWHSWDMVEKRHGMPPQHNHDYWQYTDEPCPADCPRKDFTVENDWPPTVISWRGVA